jgi:hypothetical protein
MFKLSCLLKAFKPTHSSHYNLLFKSWMKTQKNLWNFCLNVWFTFDACHHLLIPPWSIDIHHHLPTLLQVAITCTSYYHRVQVHWSCYLAIFIIHFFFLFVSKISFMISFFIYLKLHWWWEERQIKFCFYMCVLIRVFVFQFF